MISTKDYIVDFQLESLPGYAAYLLDNKLDDFSRALYEYSIELNVPLLKFFGSMSEEEIIRLSTDGVVRLLSAMRSRGLDQYIRNNNANWIRNQLPVIAREDVIVEDISLINYARKRAFRKYLPDYAPNNDVVYRVMDELDRFFLAMETESFKTYLAIQHERLNASNELLKRRESELLEAQSLSKIGSFEWDLTGNRQSRYTPEVFKIFEFEETSNLDAFLGDVHPDDRVKLQAAIEKAFTDGSYECEYRYSRRGKKKILFSKGKVIFDQGRPVRMIGTISDITERAELINRLKESEDLSKQGQALTYTGSWKWLAELDAIEWSDEMYRIYGVAPQSETITFERFLSFVHEDDRSRRLQEINDAMATGSASDYIMKIRTRDGTDKVLRGKGEVIKDKSGKSVGMLGTCQDITREFHLNNELKRKNDELERKNRELESFNFVASHDLQEPLRKIQIYSNRILNEGSDSIPEGLLNYLAKICQASTRMQKMIEDFLIFYHSISGPAVVERMMLNDAVADACALLKDFIESKNARFEVGELSDIMGKRRHLTEMLRHLISNSLKFSMNGRAPHIRIRPISFEREDGKRFVGLAISDNGIGFDPKYSTRIFDLFQRLHTSDDFPGTGIGLSLCKKIVEDHGGWISATSTPGVGSEFSIYLPV